MVIDEPCLQWARPGQMWRPMEEFERGKGNHAMLTGREALRGKAGMRIQVSSL